MRHFMSGVFAAAMIMAFIFASGVDSSPAPCIIGLAVSMCVLYIAGRYLGDD